jgi:hypothetical protein
MSEQNIAYFVVAGQSIIWRFAESPDAFNAFKSAFLEANPEYTDVEILNVARKGSTLTRGAAEYRADFQGNPKVAENYWVDELSGDIDGPNLVRAATQIASWGEGKQILGILWDLGQAETVYITPDMVESYSASLDYTLRRLMTLAKTDEVYLVPFGDRDSYSQRIDRGSDLMHELQQDFAAAHDYVTLSTATYDLPLEDTIHPDPEGMLTYARRLAETISTGEASTSLQEVRAGANGVIIVTIEGLDLELVDGSTALRLFDSDGNGVSIASIEVDREHGMLTIIPSGDAVELRYASSTFSFELAADEILFSGGLPVHQFNSRISPEVLTFTPSDGGFVIEGSVEAERINGFRTGDTLIGGGDDILAGGQGDDTYIITDGSNRIKELPGEGIDTILSTTSIRIPHNVENLILEGTGRMVGRGNGENNTLTGRDEIDVLRGYGANDLLFGLGGNDRLEGHAGDDLLDGGTDNDLLRGGDGDDMLIGGLGRDRMFGEAGADTFFFSSGDSPGLTKKSADIILDWDDDDLIDFSSFGSLTYVESFSGTAGEVASRFVGNTTFVEIDLDGDMAADFLVQLDGTHLLGADDFVL